MDILRLINNGDELERAIFEDFRNRDAFLVVATYSVKQTVPVGDSEAGVLQLLGVDNVKDWKAQGRTPSAT